MAEWDGWTLDRVVLAFSGVLYLGLWVQVTLMHWAGGFKHWAMWGPVMTTPLVVAGAAAAVVTRGGIFGYASAVVLGVGVLSGLVGLTYHLRGIAYQIGGFSLRNFLSGPPPVLPLAYSMVGLLGLGALIWNG